MRTIRDKFGYDIRVGSPDDAERWYGIECECENVHTTAYAPESRLTSAGWRTTADGSLRHNGIEFLAGPVMRTQAHSMLDALYAERYTYGFTSSIRTSMHVHANVQLETPNSVRNIVAAYCLVEPILFSMCGTDREENIYCIPFYRANLPLKQLSRALRGCGAWDNFQKYSALNLGAIHKFGTLEFRHAPLWDNVGQARLWLSVIDELMHNSRDVSPDDLLLKLRTRSVDSVVRSLIPSLFNATPVRTNLSSVLEVEWLLEYDIPTSIAILLGNTPAPSPDTFKWRFGNLHQKVSAAPARADSPVDFRELLNTFRRPQEDTATFTQVQEYDEGYNEEYIEYNDEEYDNDESTEEDEF